MKDVWFWYLLLCYSWIYILLFSFSSLVRFVRSFSSFWYENYSVQSLDLNHQIETTARDSKDIALPVTEYIIHRIDHPFEKIKTISEITKVIKIFFV